jgi:hypothetical protein
MQTWRVSKERPEACFVKRAVAIVWPRLFLALRSFRTLRTGQKNGHYGSYSTAGAKATASS